MQRSFFALPTFMVGNLQPSTLCIFLLLSTTDVPMLLIFFTDNLIRKAQKHGIGSQERNDIYAYLQSMTAEEDNDHFERMKDEILEFFRTRQGKERKKFGQYLSRVIDTLNRYSRIPHLAHRRGEGGDGDDLVELGWTNNNAESTNALLKNATQHEVKTLPEVSYVDHNTNYQNITDRYLSKYQIYVVVKSAKIVGQTYGLAIFLEAHSNLASYFQVLQIVSGIMRRQRNDVEKTVVGGSNYRLDSSISRQLRLHAQTWQGMPERDQDEHVRRMFREYRGAAAQGSSRGRRGGPSRTSSVVTQSSDGSMFVEAPPGIKKKPGMKGGVASNRTRARGRGKGKKNQGE